MEKPSARQQQRPDPKKKNQGQDDIFASLVSFGGSARQTPTLSLQEQRQQQLTPSGSSWGASELDLLGSRSSSTEVHTPEIKSDDQTNQQDDDPLAIFSKPPPVTQPKPKPKPKVEEQIEVTINDEDAEIMAGFQVTQPKPTIRNEPSNEGAIAELVDMGFSTDQAINALENSDHSVQGAVDYILNEAHRRSAQKNNDRRQRRARAGSGPERTRNSKQELPLEEQDVVDELSKMASDFSSQFISKASSWFQEGRKIVAEAIKDPGGDQRDGNGQPVWMREAELYKRQQQQGRATSSEQEVASSKRRDAAIATPELLELERDRPPLPRRRSSQGREELPRRSRDDLSTSSYRDEFGPEREPVRPHPLTEPSTRASSRQKQQVRGASPMKSSRPASRSQLASSIKSPAPEANFPSRKSRLLDEEGMDSMMYRSPNRRQGTGVRGKGVTKQKAMRPAVEISKSAQDKIQAKRESGSEAFKMGDYTKAEQDYTEGLESAPKQHLLRVMLLSNRAAALLKNGEPKRALSDCEEGLKIIGPSKGENESLGDKPLKTFWLKLSQRKAESLEQLERFQLAYNAYNELIESGNAEKTALDGKRRCENQMGKSQKPAAAAPKKHARVQKSAIDDFAGLSRPPSEAVKNLQRAKQEQESVEAERFALYDTVEAKIIQWKGGKEDNLRALLGSLHDILWAETGWKKISMADLIAPKKVKIAYMKAVAKTHPDKISVNASTEEKMISQAVFVALNKAWDDFRQANNV